MNKLEALTYLVELNENRFDSPSYCPPNSEDGMYERDSDFSELLIDIIKSNKSSFEEDSLNELYSEL